jgi:hypothetical protein
MRGKKLLSVDDSNSMNNINFLMQVHKNLFVTSFYSASESVYSQTRLLNESNAGNIKSFLTTTKKLFVCVFLCVCFGYFFILSNSRFTFLNVGKF